MGVRGVCPDRRRARRTASARFEVALQSAVQEKFSYAIAIRGLLSGRSMIVRRRCGCGLVSVVAAGAFARLLFSEAKKCQRGNMNDNIGV